MSLDHIKLNNVTREQLAFVLNRGIESSNVILEGEGGSGKALAAMALARNALSFTRENLSNITHPDFYRIEPENGIIRKEKVQELINYTMIAPQICRKHVIIIENAECMNDASANSLLKVLEDGVQTNLFILTTQSRLMPTIESRCEKVLFRPVDQEEIRKREADFDEDLWRACGGRYYRYQELLQENEFRDALTGMGKALLSGTGADILREAHAMKEKDPAYLQKALSVKELDGFFQYCTSLFIDGVAGENSLIDHYQIGDMADIMVVLQDAKIAIRTKGAYSMNDFFALLRMMIERRQDA